MTAFKRSTNKQKQTDSDLLFDPHKFSIHEIFSNNNGKTSSTKLVGFITSMICLLIFLALVVYFFYAPIHGSMILEFIDRTVSFFTISAGLMGVKSITSAFGKHKVEITENPVKRKKTNNSSKNRMGMTSPNSDDEDEENED